MLWNMSMKSRPRMSGQYASHMPHPALHALPWLGFGLECGSVWGVSLGEPIQVWWTSMWGKAFLVNQAGLVAVGWGSTYSGLWVSRTRLVFGRWKIWPDPASEVARTACLDPPRLPGLTSCPVGLDPWPGVTPRKSLPGWLNVLQDPTRNPRGSTIDRLSFSNHPAHFASSCLVGGRKAWVWCSWWSESQSMHPMIVIVRPTTNIPSNFEGMLGRECLLP